MLVDRADWKTEMAVYELNILSHSVNNEHAIPHSNKN